MDNFSQKIEEKENSDEDIQFEEVIDIDDIQKKLQEKIYEKEPANESLEDFDFKRNKEFLPVGGEREFERKEISTVEPPTPVDSNAKKYVIYIDIDNIDFMESLSMNERRSVINKILKEQNNISIKEREFNQKKRFLKHAILACFTFIIGFPLMFICVNKSLLTSISNYQLAKENFRKLYKEQGKVKLDEPGLMKNIKY